MSGSAGALGAMARANARYWPTVLPRVHRGLRSWRQEAARIPDERLRQIALAKLAEEPFNTEVAATLATLAPRRRRAAATDAIVALQVMYDYLDGVGEVPAPDPLANGQRLFEALVPSLVFGARPVDYYAHSEHGDDGGYLESLVAAAGQGFGALPSAAAVAPTARAAALRCGEAQTRTHAVAALGAGQLRDWATEQARGTGLAWWEYAAGGTASILSVHALVAAAAEPRVDPEAAQSLDRAYLYVAAISTLLDSVVDHQADLEQGGHSFFAYYRDKGEAGEGVARVIARAAAEAGSLRHGAHHRMTAAGVAAYYLSAPTAAVPPGPEIGRRARRELGPPLAAALGVFGLWRRAKARAGARRRRA